MSDALSSANKALSQVGVEVLDLHGYAQLRCSCGAIVTLDLASPIKLCLCEAEYGLDIALLARTVE